ncbi:MAG: hypothetical protein OXF56_17860 [Rhodobacteraceae bacterium]|nr:hypothetical protein [Paracoccaceae bacterium]
MNRWKEHIFRIAAKLRNDRYLRKTDIPFGEYGSEPTSIALSRFHATLIP